MAEMDIGNEIAELLQEYTDDVMDRIAKESDEIAKSGAAELRQTSPKDTGGYAAGWTKRRVGDKDIIYNKTKPGLAHLLEKPHQLVGGGLSTPKVHIEPVEERVIEEFWEAVQKAVKEGG